MTEKVEYSKEQPIYALTAAYMHNRAESRKKRLGTLRAHVLTGKKLMILD